MNRANLLAAFCAASVLLAGCGATSSDMEQRAQQDFTSGNLDAAKSEIESAQRKADSEKLGADTQQRLANQLAQVNAALEKRRISQEDDARQQGAAALAQAKADCNAKNWNGMMADMKRAQSLASKANDPALNGAIDQMLHTQPFALMRAREAYSEVCSKAGWSTVFSVFDLPGQFWVGLDSYISADSRLEMAASQTNDSELTAAGHDVTDQWRKYMNAKAIADSSANDNSGFGTVVNLVSSGASLLHAIKYANAQSRFEKRMNELLNATSMPAPTYAPTRRDAPPAPTPMPIAAAPAAPTAVPVSTGTGDGGAAHPATSTQLAAGPVANTAPPAPTTPPDRNAPNFDDLNR